MSSITKNRERTRTLVGTALLTAIVFVLQFVSIVLRGPMFSVATFALVTIVVGAALYGVAAGAWLGFVFGVAVLVSGDAAGFLTLNAAGTIITVLVKGTAAGFVSGIAYRLIEKRSQIMASLAAAVLTPIVNTGIFVIGCRLFFFNAIAAEGAGQGYNSTWAYILLVYVGINFIIELVVNLAVNPVIIRLVNIGRKKAK